MRVGFLEGCRAQGRREGTVSAVPRNTGSLGGERGEGVVVHPVQGRRHAQKVHDHAKGAEDIDFAER